LVAITPAAGFVGVPQSIFIGTIAAMVSNIVAEVLKHKTGLDDPLDVFACHGVGGMMGMLLTGVFGNKAVNSLVLDGQFLIQLKGMALAVGYSFVVSFLIFKFINFILPMRVTAEDRVPYWLRTEHSWKKSQPTKYIFVLSVELFEYARPVCFWSTDCPGVFNANFCFQYRLYHFFPGLHGSQKLTLLPQKTVWVIQYCPGYN
jgi:ammonium transporter, Amt family